MTSRDVIRNQIKEVIQDLIAKREIIEQCLKDRLAELAGNSTPSPSSGMAASVSSPEIHKGPDSAARKPVAKSTTNGEKDVKPILRGGRMGRKSAFNESKSSSQGMSADQSNDNFSSSKDNSTLLLLTQSMRATSSKTSLTSSSSKGLLRSSTGKTSSSSSKETIMLISSKGAPLTEPPASAKCKPGTSSSTVKKVPSRGTLPSDESKTPTASPRGGGKPPPKAAPPPSPTGRRSHSVTRAAAAAKSAANPHTEARPAKKPNPKAPQAEQPSATAPPAKKPPRRAQSVKKSLMPKTRPVPL